MKLPRCEIARRVDIPDYSADDPSRVYVTRWTVVATPWCSLFVHRYQAADPRDSLHNHPWPFLSVIWRGGYRERRDYSGGEVRVRWLNLKRSTEVHVITRLDHTPTWTIVFTGPRCRRWGYTDPDGSWTPSHEHRHRTELDAAASREKERGAAEGERS